MSRNSRRGGRAESHAYCKRGANKVSEPQTPSYCTKRRPVQYSCVYVSDQPVHLWIEAMTRLAFLIAFLAVVLLLCRTARSDELYLQQYENAMVESGILYNETLIFDILSLESEPQPTEYCPPLPDSVIKIPATSVHALSPYHIKVLGAVGDSVTAGFGAKAKCLLQALTEYRGVSWSIGGDSGAMTLPNIVRSFNSNVKGFSVKTGKQTSVNAHFNRAVSGAVSDQIPGEVRELVKMIKADQSINVEEDWKLITLWIGGNDLCNYCKEKVKKSAENYVKKIKEGLDIIRAELPRTYVNVVEILDVTKLGALKTGLFCDLIHLAVCPCVANSKYWSETSQASRDYNDLLEDMIEKTPEYHDSDQFAVVLQPFFKNTGLPSNADGDGDRSYFGLDCFHFTVKGHAEIASALWNNMMEPVGNKDDKVDWGTETKLKCPSIDFPYFYTDKNSKSFVSSNGENPDPNTDTDTSPINLLAVLLGTGLTVVVVVVAIAVVVVAMVYRRGRRGVRAGGVSVGVSMDTEKTRLIFQQIAARDTGAVKSLSLRYQVFSKMRIIAPFFISLLLGICSAQTSEEIFLKKYEAALNSTGIPYDETLISDLSSNECIVPPLNCAKLPDHYINTNPTSVHKLTPYNIRVMGAVGDSVTAGFGALATNIFQALTEYRGVSWSIGGDDGYTTIPNIVKEFNPNVKGFSVGKGKATSSNAHFNQAVSGAIAEDIPGQVRTLVDKIKNDISMESFNEDWKMITIWIGGNDLCAYCNDKTKYSPSEYVKHIREGLDILKAELPRTFVNLVQILDVTELEGLKGSLLCSAVKLFACSCNNDASTTKASGFYNDELENIDFNSYNTDDFAVVLQPFMKNLKLPDKDPNSYFGLDCFHFNRKGHCEAARALWNNMMSFKMEKKDSINWEENPLLKCPTEEYPYFFTGENSPPPSGFGAVNPDPNVTRNPSQTGSFLGILLGSGLTTFTVAIAIVIGVVAALAYSRHRRHRNSVSMSTDSDEKIRLV
ncbi:phospholipase B1, membrane-associated-like [Halichondria panicea]|uniref:phospholipase B1, membrane-associated-like n=1 Tax=Halichondria panicea TaxID=6063 RepID=UPI00312B9375